MRLERDPAAPRHGYTRLEQEMPVRAHGTANGYTSWGCRCDACREAWRVYSRERLAYRERIGLGRGRGIRVKVDRMVLRDPAADEREAQVLVRAWAAAWAALVPVLPRREVES